MPGLVTHWLFPFLNGAGSMRKTFLAMWVLVSTLGMDVQAGPFGLVGRRGGTVNQGGNTATHQPATRPFLGTCQDAAANMARIGRIGHFGNPSRFPFEGVGCGSTPDQAVRNCCFYGRRPLADQGVAQGANGMWFACCRYW